MSTGTAPKVINARVVSWGVAAAIFLMSTTRPLYENALVLGVGEKDGPIAYKSNAPVGDTY
jgi:hypothetical protein